MMNYYAYHNAYARYTWPVSSSPENATYLPKPEFGDKAPQQNGGTPNIEPLTPSISKQTPSVAFSPKALPVTLHHESPDIFRETPVRYTAFSNDIGESTRFLLLRYLGKKQGTFVYRGSYVATGAYGILDTLDKGKKAFEKHGKQWTPSSLFDVTAQTTGAGLFQGLASFWLPVVAIKWIREHSVDLVHRYGHHFRKIPHYRMARFLFPSITSLSAVPLLVKPIDQAVEWGLHHTYWRAVEHFRQKRFPTLTPVKPKTVLHP